MRHAMTKIMSFDKKTLLLRASFFFGLIVAGTEGNRVKRIAGGTWAISGEFKYLVAIVDGGSLGNGGRQLCGGAIITERHVLTAGHCVEGDHSLTVVTGITNLQDSRQAQVHKVSNIIQHPDYEFAINKGKYDPDIAVIVLAESLIFDGKLAKVNVPQFQVRAGSAGIFAGWGDTGPNRESSPHLKKIRLTFLDEYTCTIKRGNFAADKICAYNSNGTACGGDSGSPLVFGSYVVGVASSSWCVIGEPHMHVNVFYYRHWILETIGYT